MTEPADTEPPPGADETTPRPFRVLPRITPENEHFWLGGAEGELRFLRCRDCGTWIHPPAPICPDPDCRSQSLTVEAVSGRATVHSYTVSRKEWFPGLTPPYLIAIVELPEQPGLRLTTNLVDLDPDRAVIGLPVTVEFEEYDGVWLPFFRPDDDADPGRAGSGPSAGTDRAGPAAVPEPTTRRSASQRTAARGEREAVIAGVGQSAIGRRLDRDPLDLTVEAALAAVADAGLTLDDIDGLATYPGNMEVPPGFSGVGITDVQDALRLDLDWHAGGLESPGQLGSVINATLAVAAGLCDHVLCFRTVWEATAAAGRGRAAVTVGADGGGSYRATGFMQWTLPFGAPSAANWIAMMAKRHFHEFGTTREQLGAIPVNTRANAALNPNAIFTEPMTLDDYLSVRMISDPLGLYDCDVPADGSTAIIVSRADAADDLAKAPVRIESVGTAIRGRPSWDQWDDLTTMASRDAAAMLWERSDLGPGDVDVAELYDGFSFITLAWLEALGFCGHGEGGPFVEGGSRIALDGEIPLNTHGGQLSAGRLHGYGFLHEACLQVWGEAGARQVADVEVALAAAGGGPLAGCLLLTR